MIYRHLFNREAPDQVVKAAIIGAGQFATAILTQSVSIPRLHIPAIADIDIEKGQKAFRLAGYADDDIAICDTHDNAVAALERGRCIVVSDPLLLMDLPLDVITEATGNPEAGARHAYEAIRHGKHVAMVNKETDVTVGPMLHLLAERENVVYTAVDGDQHGLLMGLVDWARELGLEVLCGGKFRNGEIVFDPNAKTLTYRNKVAALDDRASFFEPLAPSCSTEIVQKRKSICGEMADISSDDLGEMAIAANATGLMPDTELLHRPILRPTEIPEVLCPQEDGGILSQRGTIEEIVTLRQPAEIGTGGGIFIVVSCTNAFSLKTLTTKGLIPNSKGTAALIYRPYHLCGVETPISILCAGLKQYPTGAHTYTPQVDLLARTNQTLKAGDRLRARHESRLDGCIRPAQPISSDDALPFYMVTGNALSSDVPERTTITRDHIVPPEDSVLWSLRLEQDAEFLG